MPTLKNWNEQIAFDVAEDRYFAPADVAEVRALVKAAAQRGEAVRVVGARHSTTECMVGRGVVLSMERFDQVRIDASARTATCGAGVSLNRLCAAAKAQGLQPGVVLEFGNFQLGAISGTHANDTSLRREGQFSSFVVGATLVKADGEVLEIGEGRNAELLPYLRSHFGLLGVVCEVTVRLLENRRPFRIENESLDLDHFLSHFGDEVRRLRASYDQAFGMIFPYSRRLLWQCRTYVEPPGPSLGRLDDWVRRRGINLYKDVLLPLVKAGTDLAPKQLAKLVAKAVVEKPLGLFGHGSYYIDPCDRGIVYEDDDPDFDFYDWVFPEGRWVEMVRAFLELAERFERERGFVLSLPTLVYFVNQDDSSILSRSRHGHTVAVDPTYPHPADPDWKAFRLAFDEVAMRHQGIPHVNKTRGGAVANYARACDPEALAAFLAKRRELDPAGIFVNDFYREMFSL